ncbi:uncharacterized protein O8D03_013517 [Erethizon dorsatum]
MFLLPFTLHGSALENCRYQVVLTVRVRDVSSSFYTSWFSSGELPISGCSNSEGSRCFFFLLHFMVQLWRTADIRRASILIFIVDVVSWLPVKDLSAFWHRSFTMLTQTFRLPALALVPPWCRSLVRTCTGHCRGLQALDRILRVCGVQTNVLN